VFLVPCFTSRVAGRAVVLAKSTPIILYDARRLNTKLLLSISVSNVRTVEVYLLTAKLFNKIG